MLGKTHLLGGLAAGAGVAGFVSSPTEQLACIALGAGMGLLPDIDHAGSTVGRKLPILSFMLHWIVGHRTLTHSLAALGLVALLALIILPSLPLMVAVVSGYASHLLLDYISYARYQTAKGKWVKSVGGVPLMWPSKRRYSYRLVEIGSLSEIVLTRLLLILLASVFYAFGLTVAHLL